MTSFTRLYLECTDTHTLHIITDGRGRHWISSWWLQHDHGSQQLSGLVKQVTDVLSISSVLNSVSTTSISRLSRLPLPQLNSTQLSDDRLDRFRGLISSGSPLVHHKSVSNFCHLCTQPFQGLNFVAGMLLLVLKDEKKTFCVLHTLHSPRHRSTGWRSVFFTLSSTPFYQVTASTLECSVIMNTHRGLNVMLHKWTADINTN